MKITLFILLLLPYFVFSQRIPTKPKILNITYDKPKGTKIEEKKKEIFKSKKVRRRNIGYHSLGFGIATTTFLDRKNSINYFPSSGNLFWQKKWNPRIHSVLALNSSYVSVSESQEKQKTSYFFHSFEVLGHYYIRPSRRIYYRRKSSPYLLGGLNLTYSSAIKSRPFIGLNFGLGYFIRVNDRWSLSVEQKINHFEINQESFFVSNFQINLSYIVERGLITPKFGRKK